MPKTAGAELTSLRRRFNKVIIGEIKSSSPCDMKLKDTTKENDLRDDSILKT